MERDQRIELTSAFLSLTLFLSLLYRPLFIADVTFSHDNLYWNYPVFRYFAELLLSGQLPLWNPYSHGGEPFYPLIFQMRLLEPLTWIIIGVGSFFTSNVPQLFHWNRVILTLASAFGIYLVLRPIAKNLWTRICLPPLLLLSAFSLLSFRQDGMLNLFLWIPYIHYYARKVFLQNQCSWREWGGLALFCGLSLQSYFFLGFVVWGVFWGVGAFFFLRAHLQFPDKKIFVFLLLLLLMALPNLVIFKEQDQYVFPQRMRIPQLEAWQPTGAPIPIEGRPENEVSSLLMDYSTIQRTGGRAHLTDFLQMVFAKGNRNIFAERSVSWGAPSESYLYIGVLPLLLVFCGILWGRDREKRVWLFQLAMTFLLLLGSRGGIHRLLFYILPGFSAIRNMGLFAPSFLFVLFYFFVLGLEWVFEKMLSRRWGPILFLILTADLGWNFFEARSVYSEEKVLESIFQYPAQAMVPTPPITREIAHDYPRYTFEQVPRYFELITKKATALSPIFYTDLVPRWPTTDAIERHLKSFRWNSSLLMRPYFAFIHSQPPSEGFAKTFGIGKALYFCEPDCHLKVMKRTNHIAEFSLIGPATLYFLDGMEKGWVSQIDGNAANLSPFEGIMKKIEVPEGKHQVVFQYLPIGIILAFGSYFFAAIFSFGLWVMPSIKNRDRVQVACSRPLNLEF